MKFPVFFGVEDVGRAGGFSGLDSPIMAPSGHAISGLPSTHPADLRQRSAPSPYGPRSRPAPADICVGTRPCRAGPGLAGAR